MPVVTVALEVTVSGTLQKMLSISVLVYGGVLDMRLVIDIVGVYPYDIKQFKKFLTSSRSL